ncbi:MAG: hypothetical protein EXS13_13710 [Planctomycetes bacterium]|nr:hypothetical protein [Planctomycetota bacterium]
MIVYSASGDELDPIDHNGKADILMHERAPTAATSSHYGAGFPGKLGIPTADLASDPVIGAPIDLVVSNSSGIWTLGFLLIGATPLDLPAGWGGELLVDPLVALPIPLPPIGYTLHDEIPYDAEFWGVVTYVQLLELDPWAAEGISNSDGIEVVFGQ